MDIVTLVAIEKLVKEGKAVFEIAEILGISEGVAYKYHHLVKMEDRKCTICGKPIIGRGKSHGHRKYCLECLKEKCTYCEEIFTLRGTQAYDKLNGQKEFYCSRKCRQECFADSRGITLEKRKQVRDRIKECVTARTLAKEIGVGIGMIAHLRRRMEIKWEKICPYCGKKFETTKPLNKFCSKECTYESYKKEARKPPPAERKCEYCGKMYKPTPSAQHKQRFCSRECSRKWNIENSKRKYECRVIERICVECGKSFVTCRPQQIFCSKPCYSKNRKIKKELKERECDYCGKSFRTSRSRQRFCSKECSRLYNLKPQIKKICPICSKEFKTAKSRHLEKIYCSSECSTEARIKRKRQNEERTKTCPICGKEFKTCGWGRKFCSRDCREKSRLRPIVEKICKGCGKVFKTSKVRGPTAKVYCSRECQLQSCKVPIMKRNCKYCGKEFIAKTKIHFFCSLKCWNKNNGKKARKDPLNKICKFCGKTFKGHKQRKYCSTQCQKLDYYKFERKSRKSGIEFLKEKHPELLDEYLSWLRYT